MIIQKEMSSQVVLVNPTMAKRALEKNKNNRRLSGRRVDGFARDMLSDRWKLNPQPVCFDREENLIDGQHRMAAVVKAGVSVRMMVAYNCDPEVQKVVDRTRSRSFGDTLRMGGVGSYARVAGICRALYHLDHGSSSTEAVTDGELEEVREKYGEEIEWIMSLPLPPGTSVTPYLAAICWAREVNPTAVENFHRSVQTGHNLGDGSPALVLRNTLLGGRFNRTGASAARSFLLKTLHALNLQLEGRSVRRIMATPDGYTSIAVKRGLVINGPLTRVVNTRSGSDE